MRETARELWRGGRGPILAAVSFTWLLAIGIRLVYPVLLPRIRVAFALDLATAGMVLTLLWVGYALTQFPGGLLADRIGERLVLVVSVAIAAVGTATVVVAAGFAAFVAGTVLVGVGTGLYATTRVTVLSDVFGSRAGTAIGINQSVGNVGTATLPALAGLVAVVAGWRWGFGVLLPLFAISIVGLWVTVPFRTSESAAIEGSALAGSTLEAITSRSVVSATASMLIVSFVYQGFTGFYPTYLADSKAVSEEFAATLLGLFFASGAVLQFVAGTASDRYGVRRTLAAFLGVATVSLFALPTASGTASIVALTVLLSSMLAFWPVSNAYVVAAFPDDVQGTGFGLIRTVYLLFAAAGPSVVGALADAGHFDAAFLGLGGLIAVAIVVCLAYPTVGETRTEGDTSEASASE